MRKPIFVLCDHSHAYVSRFMEYAQGKANFLFQVRGCTGAEGMEAFLAGSGAEVGLISWILWQEWTERLREQVKRQIHCLILLTDDRRSGEVGILSLYRYQSMELILRNILACYERYAKNQAEERRLKIIGFYSPIGHCGKTTAALHLGHMLAEKEGWQVLYVNLEPMGTWVSQNQGNHHSVSDLLYEKQQEGCLKLQSLSEALGKVSVLSPVVNPEDLWNMTTEDMQELMQGMRREGICDCMILDLGNDRCPIPVLKSCDDIVLIRRKSKVMAGKMENVKGYLMKKLALEDRGEIQSRQKEGRDPWREFCLPELPVLSDRLPGDGGEICAELAEWIWTQWEMTDPSKSTEGEASYGSIAGAGRETSE